MQNEVRTDFNLRLFLKILKKGKIFIIIITLLSTIAAALYSMYFVKPVYQSYVSILFTGNNNEDTMAIFADLTKSNKFAKTVSDNLNGSISYTEIQKSIKPDYKNTPILHIYAYGGSPQKAYDIANAISQSFEVFLKSYMPPNNKVEVIDKAEIYYNPINNSIYTNLVVGFLVGFIVSTCLVILAYYIKD